MQGSNWRSSRPFKKTMSAISLHSVQTVGSIVVPNYFRHSGIVLADVPENGEILSIDQFYGSQRPQWQRTISGRRVDWDCLQKTLVGLFQRQQPVLEVGELAKLHEIIRKLQNSNAGHFIYDYYKLQILTKGMIIVRENIRQTQGKPLLQCLEEAWNNLFTNILPLLEAALFLVKTRGNVTIRQTTLAAFRDVVLLKLNMEDVLSSELIEVTPGVKHMLLILYNVNDTFPPNKNKLRLESLLARVIVPLLGFKGLYYGETEPLVESSEPQLIARRRSSDGSRRISRPLSIQPQQVDTLNEMFLKAIRKQQEG